MTSEQKFSHSKFLAIWYMPLESCNCLQRILKIFVYKVKTLAGITYYIFTKLLLQILMNVNKEHQDAVKTVLIQMEVLYALV